MSFFIRFTDLGFRFISAISESNVCYIFISLNEDKFLRCIRLDSFDMSWHAKPEILSFGFSFISTSKSSISRMYPLERNMRGFKYKLTIFSLIWNKDIVSLYEHCTLKVWNVLLYLTNHSTHYIQHISRDWYVAKRNTLPLFFFLTVKSNPRNCLYASNVLGHYALKGNVIAACIIFLGNLCCAGTVTYLFGIHRLEEVSVVQSVGFWNPGTSGSPILSSVCRFVQQMHFGLKSTWLFSIKPTQWAFPNIKLKRLWVPK